MKKTLTTIIVIIILVGGYLFFTKNSSLQATNEPPQAIQESFEDYQAAILARDPSGTELLSEATIGYYDHLIDLIKNADRTTLEAAPLADRIVVLMTRSTYPHEELLAMDGEGLVREAIVRGEIGDNVANLSLGKTDLKEDVALIQVLQNGQEIPVEFTFLKEDGVWKMDLVSLLPGVTFAMESVLAQSGLSEEEFIIKTIKATRGEETPTEDMWAALQ